MYKSLSIKNFKQLKSLSITGLDRINVITGKNNTGKSSILEALFFLLDRDTPAATVRSAIWRGINMLQMNEAQLWGYLFPEYDTSLKMEIRLENGPNDYNSVITYQGEHSFPITAPVGVATSATSGGVLSQALILEYRSGLYPEASIGRVFVQNNQPVLIQDKTQGIHPAVYSSSRVRNNAEDASRLSQLISTNSMKPIISALQVLEPRLNALHVLNHTGETLPYADVGLPRFIPVALLGDGVAKLLSTLLSIAAAANGQVFIDEIENGFHHSILASVWQSIYETAVKYNTQVFVTTHSYEMLSALINKEGKLLDGVVYFRLDRSDTGEIKVVDYPSDVLASSLASDWEVR